MSLSDLSLITSGGGGRGGGGEGGQAGQLSPLQKEGGAEKVLAMLKGGRDNNKF